MGITKAMAIDLMNEELDSEDTTQQVGELCSINNIVICICGSTEIAKNNMCYNCWRQLEDTFTRQYGVVPSDSYEY